MIEFGVVIKNVIGLYVNKETLMSIIVNKYERKCSHGMYIEKIIRITKQSDCVINKHGSPCDGDISVICEVQAIKYARGEIINGCVIESKDKSGIVVCRVGHLQILLSSSAIFESMTKGQMMSVRVNKARYTPNMETVAINAVPFLPSREFTLYKINPGAVNDAVFNDIRERIAFEEKSAAELKSTHASAYALYEQLLCPYDKSMYVEKSPSTRPPSKEFPLMEFITDAVAGKNMTGYIARDPRILPSRSFVSRINNSDPNDNLAKVADDVSLEAVCVELLEDYCAHLRNIREYVELYSAEQVNAHVNLWAIYKKNLSTPV